MFASDEVKTLLPITKKFGVCVPTNERQLVKVDGIHTRGNNGDYYLDEDESRGNLLTYDLWWTSFDTTNKRARKYLKKSKETLHFQLRKQGLEVKGWREVPINKKVCGKEALSTLPVIEQII